MSRHCRAPREMGSPWRRLIEATSRNGHSAVPRRLTDPMGDWARREVRGARVEVRRERVHQLGGGGCAGVGKRAAWCDGSGQVCRWCGPFRLHAPP